MARSFGLLSLFIYAVVAVLALAVGANAQAPGDPTLSQGLKPYGSYAGGNIDLVSFENGKLDLHIPLLSYPQRGKLQMNFTIRYNNPGYTLNKVCLPLKPPPPCTYNVSSNFTRPGPWGVSVVPDFSALTVIPTGIWNPANDTYSGNGDYPIIYMPDGSSHPTGYLTGTANYRATDASGWMVNSTAQNFIPGTITDPDGTRYSINSSDVLSLVEDTNGNQITTNSTGWTDSLGRSIPVPPTPTSGVAGTLSTCPAGALTAVTAYAWNVPAPLGGTDTYTFCYVNLTVDVKIGSFSPTTPFQLTPVMLQSIVLPNGQSWGFTYDGAADLTQITLPTGGTISYGNSLVQMCVVGGAFPQNFLSTVVSRTVNANDGTGAHIWSYGGSLGGSVLTRTVTDPAGNQEVHTLTGLVAGGYATCRYYDTQVKKYQGSSASGTLLQTVTTNYSYNADPYAQPNPGAGAAASVVNVVPTSITTAWANGQTSQVTKTYDSGFTYFSTWTGLYGKVMSESDLDYGSGAPGPLLRRTVNNYQAFASSNYLTYNILDPLYSVAVYDSAANSCKGVANTYCAYTYFGYDEVGLQSSGITTQHDSSPVNGSYRGNQTSVHKWLTGSTVAQGSCPVSSGYVVSSEVFFDTGEVQKSSDPCGYPTTFLYSSTYAGALPTTITNALSQSTVNMYDFNTGLLLTTTDPNQQLTSYTYDPSWRLTLVSYPDGGSTGYSYTDSIPASVTVTKAINSSLNLVQTAVLDGLERVSQTQLVDPNCHATSGLVYVNYGYGYNSSTTTTTGAYTTVSNPYCQTSDTTYGVTTKNEDALGRVASLVEADGSQVLTAYSGNCTTVTDEAGKSRQSCIDGLGRMTSLLEDPGSSPHLNYQTLYQYDALDNLNNVTQNGSNSSTPRTRRFVYDSLSHITSATNPESGTISYAYDADGNVATKTAPKPNQSGSLTVQTSYIYDTLNRLSEKNYNDGSTPTVQYGYDHMALTGCKIAPQPLSDSYPIGRRTAMCDGAGGSSWSHDMMGRILDQRRTTGAAIGDYEIDTYNFDGSPRVVTTLGFSVAYGYNAAERPISAVNNGTNPATKFVTAATYAPPGELATMTMGSTTSFTGIVTSNAYNNRLQPILLSAAVAGQNAVFGECFDFHLGVAVTTTPCSFSASKLGDNGNVYQVVNNRDNTRTQSFTYDTLNRIYSAQSTGPQWGETFTIDAWGNMTNEAGIAGKTNSEGLNTSASTNNQLSGFGYDAAGNMISNGTISFVYDAENRLIATGGYSYLYDGDGQRVEKCTEGTTPGTCASGATGTLYWRGNAASDALKETDLAGNGENNYVFFNGQRVARSDSAGAIHYYFSDHLGSHGVVENATGSVCEQDIDYYPYGGMENDYCPTAAQNYKFTGKERDAESGLDNFGARYDASSMGRFMTPDSPAYSNHKNPQSWNLYAYALNNPVTFRDADGHLIVCANNASQCQKDAAAATGNAQAASQVTTQTTTTQHSFLGLFHWTTSQTQIAIAGDINSFRALSPNASKLADLVTSKDTVTVSYDQYAKPSFFANSLRLNGGSQSYVPSEGGLAPQAFIDPTRTPGAVYDPDAVAQGIPQANTAEEFGHEILGHIWGELFGGAPAGTRANMRDSIIGEDAVRALDPTRGQKGLESHHDYQGATPDPPKPQ